MKHNDGGIMGDEMCEHGLSAWLCMGPNHYPTDEQEMRGELYP